MSTSLVFHFVCLPVFPCRNPLVARIGTKNGLNGRYKWQPYRAIFHIARNQEWNGVEMRDYAVPSLLWPRNAFLYCFDERPY